VTRAARLDPGQSRGWSLEAGLIALGTFCWKHARWVVAGWLLAVALAAIGAGGLSQRLLEGSGDLHGSMSQRVDRTLSSHFPGKDSQSLILVFRSAALDRHPAKLAELFEALESRLSALPAVRKVTGETELAILGLSPKPGAGHLLVVDLATDDLLATEQQVAKLRASVAPLFRARAEDANLRWAVTGRAALTYDVNRFNAQDTARSELRALPLTLLVLLFAFGSMAAALLPLVLAVASRTVALGIVFLLAGAIEISNLVQSIVTMLSIALGIDYSLFLVHRYRQELHAVEGDGSTLTPGEREQGAMRRAMAQSGTAVVYSAATVAIGMGALFATPLMQTRSIGLGGLLAAAATLIASLTLVPAFLRLLRPRVLEWPQTLSRRMNNGRSRRLWTAWAKLVVTRPLPALALSLALLAALSAPALHTRFGFPESEFLPAELEYAQGMTLLEDMELRGVVSPLLVVVTDRRGGRALTPERLPLLTDFVLGLEQDRRVRLVLGPVQTDAALPSTFESAVARALSRRAFVSADDSRLLFQIIPSDRSDLADLRRLAHDIPDTLDISGLAAEVGGQAQYYNDFDEAVIGSYPLTMGLVLGISVVALLLVFKAVVASLKAIVLNLLSVAAGYGVVVLVFQLGYGSELFGMTGPTAVVPVTVPLVIFCILFGLSMDYEIFLLSRIRSLYLSSGDNQGSIREALADTGSVITSAALIMVIVFGAFAFSRVFIVQMIGLGLAVAVLVDATVIRSVLGPALMQLAGRFNWWPALNG
jgi:RND superfamily putative drug exporter